jgi:2-polyprenyl-3-methyl-5-hydroxy-6-metoxy-1,4-benzoquinol methylase
VMSATLDKISDVLQSRYIQGSVPDFIETVSNIYHHYESAVYDTSQVSLNDSIWSWQAALKSIQPDTGSNLRLLDYGAGTGFATLQVLQSSLGPSIKEVVCYDLSPAMMEICKEKMKAFPSVSFLFLSDTAGREKLSEQKPFDLVVTNALLHHLLEVENFIHNVRQWVAPSGYYIAGHEPNYNFYYNTKLVNATKKFQQYKRIKQRLTLKYWLHKTGIKKSFHDLVTLTNNELMKRKLIRTPIQRNYLHKLVDIHVPFGISTDQPWGEIGFKDEKLAHWLGSDFVMTGIFTYSHIKDGLANHDWIWKRRLERLRKAFPNDGADALMIFKRKS